MPHRDIRHDPSLHRPWPGKFSPFGGSGFGMNAEDMATASALCYRCPQWPRIWNIISLLCLAMVEISLFPLHPR